MFRSQKMQRAIAALVLTTFTSLSLYPLTAAAQAKEALEQAGVLPSPKDEGIIDSAKSYIAALAGEGKGAKGKTADERFAHLLNDIHEDLKAAVPEVALPQDAKRFAKGKFAKADHAAKAGNIRAKRKELKQLYADIEQSFKETGQQLKDKNLPQAILDRHDEAVTQFGSRKAEFEKLMDKLDAADDANNAEGRQAALEALGGFMAKHPNAKPHQYTDPNKLPFRTPDGKVRKPYETPEDYQANLFPPKYEKVLLASTSLDGVKLTQATLPQTPAPQDLSETDDVQITQAIRDKAAELEKQPVKIYNWVRNNIEFIPSYGSIQGADMTLQNKRGNAFDTASLLIALYRASGIPARYVYGTIEVPVDKVMNWVGGVTKPEAAQSLLGQGGIPNVGLIAGGTVKAIRMEHVWVEAYVDYTPSRGAVNKSPNTWVPMDASFKQYRFTSGMDIKGNVQLNAQNLIDQVKQDATINETQGYVQNLNTAKLQTQLVNYQAQVQNYIDSQKANATVGDVLGAQKVVEQNNAILLGSLPYKTVATGNRFQALPDNLRLKIAFNLYTSEIDKAYQSPAFTKVLSFSSIGSKRLAVTYVPATEADQQLLKQYSDSQANTLPSYLVRQKAQMRLDDTVLAEYSDQQMGQAQYWTYTLLIPGGSQIEEDFKAESSVGDEIVFSVNGNGVTSTQVASRFNTVNPNTSLENLNQVALGYWARADMSDDILARESRYVTYRQPSVGMFALPLTVRYYFGIPRLASYKSYLIDIRRLTQSAASMGSNGAATDFLLRSGMKNSYLEGTVLEEILDLGKGQAMSAVAVIKEANEIGIPIWALSSNNLTAFQNVTTLSYSTRQAINNAIAAGLTVYAPQGGVRALASKPVNFQ